eukprot:sb/3462708/
MPKNEETNVANSLSEHIKAIAARPAPDLYHSRFSMSPESDSIRTLTPSPPSSPSRSVGSRSPSPAGRNFRNSRPSSPIRKAKRTRVTGPSYDLGVVEKVRQPMNMMAYSVNVEARPMPQLEDLSDTTSIPNESKKRSPIRAPQASDPVLPMMPPKPISSRSRIRTLKVSRKCSPIRASSPKSREPSTKPVAREQSPPRPKVSIPGTPVSPTRTPSPSPIQPNSKKNPSSSPSSSRSKLTSGSSTGETSTRSPKRLRTRRSSGRSRSPNRRSRSPRRSSRFHSRSPRLTSRRRSRSSNRRSRSPRRNSRLRSRSRRSRSRDRRSSSRNRRSRSRNRRSRSRSRRRKTSSTDDFWERIKAKHFVSSKGKEPRSTKRSFIELEFQGFSSLDGAQQEKLRFVEAKMERKNRGADNRDIITQKQKITLLALAAEMKLENSKVKAEPTSHTPKTVQRIPTNLMTGYPTTTAKKSPGVQRTPINLMTGKPPSCTVQKHTEVTTPSAASTFPSTSGTTLSTTPSTTPSASPKTPYSSSTTPLGTATTTSSSTSSTVSAEPHYDTSGLTKNQLVSFERLRTRIILEYSDRPKYGHNRLMNRLNEFRVQNRQNENNQKALVEPIYDLTGLTERQTVSFHKLKEQWMEKNRHHYGSYKIAVDVQKSYLQTLIRGFRKNLEMNKKFVKH